MKREHEMKQAEEELMQNLKDELYKEQNEEQARQRERDELDKLMRQKELMKIAEIEDRKLKMARKQ
jgi:hypothetical protein